MLRPSKLPANTADGEKVTNNVFKLKPSSLLGAQAAAAASDQPQSTTTSLFQNPFLAAANSIDQEDSTLGSGEDTKDTTAKKTDENSDPLSQLSRTASLPKSNLFTSKSSFSEASGFVFGQNISERVTNAATEAATAADEPSAEGLLFSSRLAGSSLEAMETKEVDGKSLLEATKKYEESTCVLDPNNFLETNRSIFCFFFRN